MVQSIITNGIIVYVHMAAANSADGMDDFTLDPYDGGDYACTGEYTDEDPTDSTDPAAYTWTAVEPEERTPYKPKLEDVADEVVVNKEATDQQIGEVNDKATAAEQVAAATANYFFADQGGTHVASAEGDATTGFNTLGTSTGFAIRNGTDVLSAWSASAIEFYDDAGNTIASFGDTVTLGDDSKAHAEIDFNSLTLYDTSGAGQVFEVGDLRNASGVATLTETFTPTSATSAFGLTYAPTAVTGVTVDGAAVSYTVSNQTVTLGTAATVGQTVAITYTTTAAVTSLTFGARSGNTGANSVVLGDGEASGELSLAEGYGSQAIGQYSHAEGAGTVAKGRASHAEGWGTQATSYYSHAEGFQTVSSGNYTHAEGTGSKATTAASHAEGNLTEATASYAHAEGTGSKATAMASHAEGRWTKAFGEASHSEGSYTEASGNYSHAHGEYTIAQGQAQTALGAYNIAQGTANSRASSDHAVIVGNGADANNRSNALTLTWGGDLQTAGDIEDGGGNTLSDKLDASALTPQVLSVTDAGASGVSIATTRVVRSGNVVSLMTEITLSAAVSDWTTIITGLPPTATGISHIWTEANWQTSFRRALRCQVTNSGAIQIRYGYATIYRLNTTYICAE